MRTSFSWSGKYTDWFFSPYWPPWWKGTAGYVYRGRKSFTQVGLSSLTVILTAKKVNIGWMFILWTEVSLTMPASTQLFSLVVSISTSIYSGCLAILWSHHEPSQGTRLSSNKQSNISKNKEEIQYCRIFLITGNTRTRRRARQCSNYPQEWGSAH